MRNVRSAQPIPGPVVRRRVCARHDWLAEAGAQQREVRHEKYERKADFVVSTTDPDATFMYRRAGGTHLGYHTHYVVDGGQARIILVPPAEVLENRPALDLVWQTCCQLGYTSMSPMMGRGVVCRAGR